MHIAAPRIFSAAARRRLVATLAAAATAFALMTAAAAVPARAAPDAEDYAKALAAIAAVAIIAHAARKDGRRHPQPAPAPDPVHGPGWGQPGGHWGHPGQGWGHGHGGGWRGRILPAACALEFPGHRGPRTYYAEPCLRRSGVEARLPRACAEQARLRGRVVPVYAERCLVEAGFRPEGHRRGPRSADHW